MFSSNQILEISGDIKNKDDLRNALEFVLKKSNHKVNCFKIVNSNRYILGWNENCNSYTKYPFDVTIDILEPIIKDFLEKQEIVDGPFDGSYHKGFLITSIKDKISKEDIFPDWEYAILSISPFTCFYHK